MKRLKIISDGKTVVGTRVVDADTGEDFPFPITKISWVCDATAAYTKAFIEIQCMEAEIPFSIRDEHYEIIGKSIQDS